MKAITLSETYGQDVSARALPPARRSTPAQQIPADVTVKPPLKWAGGKRWLVPQLAELWQLYSSRRYVEPFCGGLAGALGLRPARAVLNDVNPHLINFYTQLQHGLEITIQMRNEEKRYYRYRGKFNKLIANGESQSAEAAQLFYYLNRTCFNGLCRFNQSGEFNVPFGTHNSITYAKDFSSFRKQFENWAFACGDLKHIRFEPGDFIYADPPYDVLYSRATACV